MKAVLSFLLTLALPLPLSAGELPPLILPRGMGINIHFTRGHEKDIELIAAAGFRLVRMDFGWSGTERTRGVYDWSAYDRLTSDLERHGLGAIYILDYSNPLYEEVATGRNPFTGKEQRALASPQHPASIAAFARWAAAAAAHFRGRPVLWEIWNEPNIAFWRPRPDVNQYIALARATCRAVHAADPHATILAPAASGVPLPFLDAFCASGVLADLDAISVHPYRGYHRPPETAADDYRKLRALIERHAPAAKKQMPIVSGEWGYATHERGIKPVVQAAFLVRQQLANLLDGVPISIWYDWKNDGTDPNEIEHNFGIVDHDLRPKPAYLAAQTLSRELAGFRIARRLKTESNRDYLLLLRNSAGQEKLAAWTTGSPHSIEVDLPLLPGRPLSAVTLTGDTFTLRLENGKLHLRLRTEPCYIEVKG